ncbi:universal stress protein [Marinobacterium sp. D7]|uniref:universal stress protein n=1 Tax=Marinobacterium ramblicola TaxID=2849041 RepID=UPI001C2DE0A3|nr:universal stress protein [Marinobacterium ramblicola]MBV1789968.1 universal stress protein [Marinobacterium ramblicola]
MNLRKIDKLTVDLLYIVDVVSNDENEIGFPMKKIERILYASDLGGNSRPAFRAAIHQAAVNDAQIIYLHVLEPIGGAAEELINAYLPESLSQARLDKTIAELKKRICQRLSDFHEEELAEHWADEVKEPIVEVIQGKADKCILKAAHRFDADLIVMGDRSSSSLARVFLGSTAQKVIHHSDIPVLIVPLKADSGN